MPTATALTQRFVILAAIDESPAADLVIARTATFARNVPGAEIHLLHVPDRFTHAPVTATTFDLDHASRYIEGRVREAHGASSVPVVGHLFESEPASAVVQLAASLDADLVVVGTNDAPAVERWVLGSVAQKVMQHAACPVLVVRAKDHVRSHAPEIEPPCPDCIALQTASRGAKLWCARHGEHHPRAHLHYEIAEGFGAGSSLIQS
jgi:nucleotide-binding universal stress UspA family protein